MLYVTALNGVLEICRLMSIVDDLRGDSNNNAESMKKGGGVACQVYE